MVIGRWLGICLAISTVERLSDNFHERGFLVFLFERGVASDHGKLVAHGRGSRQLSRLTFGLEAVEQEPKEYDPLLFHFRKIVTEWETEISECRSCNGRAEESFEDRGTGRRRLGISRKMQSKLGFTKI